MNYSIKKGNYEITFGIQDDKLVNPQGHNLNGEEKDLDSCGMNNTEMGNKGYGIYGQFNPIVYVKGGKIIGIKEPQEDLKLSVYEGNSEKELEIDKKGRVKKH